MDTIGNRIGELIYELRLSKNAFAKELNTSSSRISNITTGRNKPDSDLLAAIVSTFRDVNPRWLLTGEGEMSVTNEIPNESVDYDLTFLKPWKSKAKVRFELQEAGQGTKVTWLMDSPWPFYLFFLKKMTTALIGMDYDRGLSMLTEYIEDGKVHSEVAFKGTQNFPGYTYIGYKTACTMGDIGHKMKEDFEKLEAFLKGKEDIVEGPVFSIYHKFDMVKGDVVYTAGISMKEMPTELGEGMITGEIPATQVNTVQHVGPYHHLGNAWSAQYSMKQYKKFKMKKGIDPFEVYVNDPAKVDAKELVTEVHFAVR